MPALSSHEREQHDSAEPDDDALLEVRNIRVRYGGVEAVSGASLQIVTPQIVDATRGSRMENCSAAAPGGTP